MRHPLVRRCAVFLATLLLRALLVHPLAAALAALRTLVLGG